MGDNWKTFAEISIEFGDKIGASKLRAVIAESVASGVMEMFEGTATTNGRLNRAVWYRPATT